MKSNGNSCHGKDMKPILSRMGETMPSDSYDRNPMGSHHQNWPDVNKILMLRNGLNCTIRACLAQQLNLP
jgi:hypothetical protein